jgi:hypothetical protein
MLAMAVPKLPPPSTAILTAAAMLIHYEGQTPLSGAPKTHCNRRPARRATGWLALRPDGEPIRTGGIEPRDHAAGF